MNAKVGLKKCLAFGLCLAVFPIGGCSQTPDALTLMETASKEMEKLDSYEVDMLLTFNMGISDGQNEVNIGINGEGMLQMINDPFVSYGEANVTIDGMGQEETVVSKSYQYEEDGTIIQYVDDGSGWSTQPTEGLTIDTAQNTMGLFDQSVVDKFDPKVTGSKTIDDADTWEITFTVAFDDLVEMSEGEIDSSTQVFLDSFGQNIELNCNIYVDKETNRYVKAIMSITGLEDLVNLAAKFSEDMPEDMEISMDDITFEFDYGRFNKIDKIDKPQGLETMSMESGNTASNAWGTMGIQIGSKKLTIGECTLQQLLDAGFTLNDSQILADTMESGDVQYGIAERDGNEFYIGIENTTTETVNTEEATVYSIYGYYLNSDIILDGGIHPGSTQDEVIKAYGEPVSITNESYYDLWYYEISDTFSSKYLELGMEDGVVTDIDLSIYNFNGLFSF